MLIAEKSKVFINNSQVVMAGFGLAQLDKYVKRMQEYGYTITFIHKIFREKIQQEVYLK